MKIQDTKTFKQMSDIQQKVIIMYQNRKTICDSVLLLKNVGLQQWETLSINLHPNWKNIVKELAAV